MQRNLLTLAVAVSLLATGPAYSQTSHGPGPRPDHGQQGGGHSAGSGPAGMMMGQNGTMMMGPRGAAGAHTRLMSPGMLTMMMVMMDTNADRAVSLEEFQAVHARMFKYADADNDGKLTFEELRNFHAGDINPNR